MNDITRFYIEICKSNPELDELEPSTILGMKVRAAIDFINIDNERPIDVKSFIMGVQFRDVDDDGI
jgi:argininosuccinate synthase